MKETKVKIPFGCWDADGNWYHNRLLSMSRSEQYQLNLKNGFFEDKHKSKIITGVHPDDDIV